MKQTKIIYWFKENNLSIEQLTSFDELFFNSNFLIPFFCLDNKLSSAADPASDQVYFHELIFRLHMLREQLKKHKSNLLILSGKPEYLLPSVARVLEVSKVITAEITSEANYFYEKPTTSNQKAEEEKLQKLLNHHSIKYLKNKCVTPQVIFTQIDESKRNSTNNMVKKFFLPPFPDINPGKIPLLTTIGSPAVLAQQK